MKFAILTSNPSSFAYVASCMAAQSTECVRFDDALSLLRARRTETFELLMIDAQQFRTAGQLVLSWRECNADMCWPTLVFGQFADREDMAQAFNAGVDDVLTGHFTAEELRARVQRALRRVKPLRQNAGIPVVVGPYQLCRLTRTATVNNIPIRMTAREFATAWLLFSAPGTFLSRQQIASAVWGADASIVERSMEQHIYKLRKKLQFGPETGVDLKTVYARGYQLTVQTAGNEPTVSAPSTVLTA
ncbi:histidine kinase [Ralstonia sp. A12]|uniref:response regulator transcription factor n=1 Tax=Ralstonia sp. A12 TaxID=1217052 RepID=UPI0005740C0D|nr:response regulator transcription factor [Ralstonia sp. A12]KHK49837.1 histidine kinase [Ralstonia sp. A12]